MKGATKKAKGIPGEMKQCDDPDWEPLVRLIGEFGAGWFMWMAEMELDDGTRIHSYKHKWTRSYLHLEATGRAFNYRPDGTYPELEISNAVCRALSTSAGAGLCCLGCGRSDHR